MLLWRQMYREKRCPEYLGMTVKDDVSLRWVLCLTSVELACFIHHEHQLRGIKLRCITLRYNFVVQHAHH